MSQDLKASTTGIGTLLSALRSRTPYSVREVAEFSGVDHAYIYRLEKGEKEAPSSEVLAKLAKVLKPNEREGEMLEYLAAHPQVDPELVLYVFENPAAKFKAFRMVASASFRGTARSEYAKQIARAQRFLDDDSDG
jgi:transcriptional regulator with XRE-family HTH domain